MSLVIILLCDISYVFTEYFACWHSYSVKSEENDTPQGPFQPIYVVLVSVGYLDVNRIFSVVRCLTDLKGSVQNKKLSLKSVTYICHFF